MPPLSNNFNQLKPYLFCKVTNSPLYEAVFLTPCGCRVEQVVVEKLWGKSTSGKWQLGLDNNKCPISSEHIVEGCFIDQSMRDIVRTVFKGAYPGESSEFIHSKGDWEIKANSKTPQAMKFVSANKNAFIKNFELRSHDTGRIYIWIKFNQAFSTNFLKFLAANDLLLTFDANETAKGIYATKDLTELKKLFNLIRNYNNFPVEYCSRLNNLILDANEPISSIIDPIPVVKVPALSYPGKSSEYTLIEGSWNPKVEATGVCRKLLFKPNSETFFTEFKILGFVHGDLRIRVNFHPSKCKEIENYFQKKYGLKLKLTPKGSQQGFHWSSGSKELRAIYHMVTSNNKFTHAVLAEIAPAIEKGKLDPQVPYPGKAVTLKHRDGNWEQHPVNSVGYICQLGFATDNMEGLITSCNFFGLPSGSVKIGLNFSPTNSTKIIKYFEDLGLKMDDKPISIFSAYVTENDTELKVVCNALLANKIFPKEYVNQIRKIVEIGKVKVDKTKTTPSIGNVPLSSQLERELLLTRLHEAINNRVNLQNIPSFPVDPISYPGKKATFELVKGDWTDSGNHHTICRKLVFQSKEPDTLISHFKLHGLLTGSLGVCFKFNTSNLQNIKKYFEGKGVKLRFSLSETKKGFYKTINLEEIRVIFNEICENNAFPEDKVVLMKDIIAKGSFVPSESLKPVNLRSLEEESCRQQ